MTYKLYEDESDLADLYKDLKLGDDSSYLNDLNTPRFGSGMLPDYAEAQRNFDDRFPRADIGNALLPAVLRDRGAIDDDAELAKSNFLRSEKSGYEMGDFDTRDLNGAGNTVSALFKKNYGYTPSVGELNQYANLISSSAPGEFSANIKNSGAYLPSRLHQDQLNEKEGTSQARGLLSKFSGNDNDLDETRLDKLINGYSEKEDTTGNSEYDQSRPGQDDMKREIDLLNRRTNTLASDSKSGVISSNGRDYYLTMRDPNGLGIYQNMDVGASLPAGRRSDQGINAGAMQKVVVTGKRMTDQEKENYDREQMQLSMRKSGIGSRILNTPRESDANFQSNGASFRSDNRTSLGKLSEKYESGGRGPGVVSNGKGDNGGVSYGTFQLASKMKRPQEFLQSEGRSWAPQFGDADPTLQNGEFGRVWKNTANEDREIFAKAQYDYIKRTHYDDVVKRIEKNTGVKINELPPAIQDVVWSTAVQHGPYTKIPAQVIRSMGNINPNSDDFNRRFINGIYDERSRRRPNGELEYFSRSSAKDQAGVASRFIREKNDALNMLNSRR